MDQQTISLISTSIIDTHEVEKVFKQLYPKSISSWTMGRMLSRMIIIFLTYPVNEIDDELLRAGFFPSGKNETERKYINIMFSVLIGKIKAINPGKTSMDIRNNLVVGFVTSDTKSYLIVSDVRSSDYYNDQPIFIF